MEGLPTVPTDILINHHFISLHIMTKVYVMATCPDCTQVKEELKNHPQYSLIDIGEHVRNLKEFLRLRDTHPAFAEIKAQGAVGIPCFVTDDGRVSFEPDEFLTDYVADGAACSLNGKGC